MKAMQKIMAPASEGRLSQLREEAIETAQKLEELQRQIAEIETVLAERKAARLGKANEKLSEQSSHREAA
jgi:hypothetical protein